MTKFGQAEYLENLAKAFVEHKLDKLLKESEKQILWREYLRTSLMKFLKQPTNRILTAKIRKIYTVSSRLQGTQHKGVKKC